MTLEPGERLGVYAIGSRLGSGAMGDVFRARDLRLGREVALKVLPDRFQDDPERRARFEAEALALSALNHPNVVTVYGAETEGGVSFIAMELVEGRTLRSLLADGPLPPKRALEIAAQTAAGLAAAHARGVVHRDLKPENVMIGPGGLVKVVDFGIARRTLPAGEGGPRDPTLRMAPHLTEAGAIIGTAGYMSPEQVEGREADFRSDQFAFGTVLYEMLSGKAPFRRASAGETLAAILRDEAPPLPPLPSPFAAPVAWILERCLMKDPAERYGSTGDLAHDLAKARDLAAHGSQAETPAGVPRVAVPLGRTWKLSRLGRGLLLLLASILAAGATWLGLRMSRREAPEFRKVTFRKGLIGAARFASPDGATVVYSAAWDGRESRVYRARVDAPGSTTLPFGDAGLLAFSPKGKVALCLRPRPEAEGTFIGTLAEAQLEGETARSLTEDVIAADFAPDGAHLAIGLLKDGVCRLEYPPGRKLYETAGWVGPIRFSPDGSRIAFFDHPFSHEDRGEVAVVDLAGVRRVLSDQDGEGWAALQGLAWSSSGDRLWFAASGSFGARGLWVVETGGKVRHVATIPGSPTLQDVSRDGRILLSRESRWIGIVLRFRDGREEDVSWLDSSMLADLSADGKTLLFTEYGDSVGGAYDVYVRKGGGAPVRLGAGIAVALSPDGARALAILPEEKPRLVAYPREAGPSHIYPPAPVERIHWATFLPDGKNLLLAANASDRGVRLWVQSVEGGALRPVSEEGIRLAWPGIALSADGRRVAAIGPGRTISLYDLAGVEKVKVLPGLDPELAPVEFSPDGRTLFAHDYRSAPTRLYRIDVESGARTLAAELAPSDRAGLWAIPAVHVSADESVVAYSYIRTFSELYVVDGLK